jgi:hypothetical protein
MQSQQDNHIPLLLVLVVEQVLPFQAHLILDLMVVHLYLIQLHQLVAVVVDQATPVILAQMWWDVMVAQVEVADLTAPI